MSEHKSTKTSSSSSVVSKKRKQSLDLLSSSSSTLEPTESKSVCVSATQAKVDGSQKKKYKLRHKNPGWLPCADSGLLKSDERPSFTSFPLHSSATYSFYSLIPEEIRMTDEAWDHLTKTIVKKIPLRIFGKLVWSNHYGTVYNTPYTFSGTHHEAVPIDHPFIQMLLDFTRKWLNNPLFNQLIVNQYVPGQSVGFHSDDEKQLVPNQPIVCFSFGEEYSFAFIPQPKFIKDDVYPDAFSVETPHNSCYIMAGTTQKYYKHGIAVHPDAKKPRVSITIRCSTLKGLH